MSGRLLLAVLAAVLSNAQTATPRRFLYGPGATLQLTAGCDSPLWRSSDEYLATVDSSGLVTARAFGPAAIVASCASTQRTCT